MSTTYRLDGVTQATRDLSAAIEGAGARMFPALEPPKFARYRLPDGRIVPVDASAAKDARLIKYMLRDGTIVDAIQVEGGR